MSTIPVFAVPVLNRGDLLLRLVRSIDYPVGRLVVVNNGTDPSVTAALEAIVKDARFDLHVHGPEHNLGVSGSWNWSMHRFPDVDYWVHTGSDVSLNPGDLRLIDEGMQHHPEMGFRAANLGYNLFAIRRATLATVGCFDENFYPAYFEDGDYQYRLSLAGIQRQAIGTANDETDECRAIHGEAPTWGSHTIHSDAALRDANGITFANNRDYYLRKWGGGPGEERFTTPFDDPDLPVSYWVLETDRCERNRAVWEAAMRSTGSIPAP